MNAPPANTRVCPALLRIPPAPPPAPRLASYAVGEAPPADIFARHTIRRSAAERTERWRDRLHGAALAVAFAAILAGAYAIAPLTAGPIRPHVASIEVAR
jgi:hypothetical protein